MARHLDRCRAICYPKCMTTCGWFLECTNEATTKVFHPILGDVPTCERCAKIATNAHDPKSSECIPGCPIDCTVDHSPSL